MKRVRSRSRRSSVASRARRVARRGHGQRCGATRRRPRRSAAPRRRVHRATAPSKTLKRVPGRAAAATPRARARSRRVSFHSAPPPRSSKKGDSRRSRQPDASMNAAQRDERQNRAQAARRARSSSPRSRASRRSSRDRRRRTRPIARSSLRRLAEDYVELESAAFRDKTEAEIKRDDAKKKNPASAGKQQAIAKPRKTTMDRARKAAIKYYTTSSRTTPAVVRPIRAEPAAEYPLLDEVLYYLAYEYEQASDLENARTVYLELIRRRRTRSTSRTRTSRSVSSSSTRRRAIRRKWDLAEQAYNEGHQVPAAGEQGLRLRPVQARLRLLEQGRLRRTRSTSSRRRSSTATQYSQLPNAAKLADCARRDIIPVYALAGDPTRRLQLLQEHLGRPVGRRTTRRSR